MAKREKLKPLPAKSRTQKPRTANTREPEVAKRRSFYAIIIARYLQLIRGRK